MVADTDGFVLILMDPMECVDGFCRKEKEVASTVGGAGQAQTRCHQSLTYPPQKYLCYTDTPPQAGCTSPPWPASQCGCHGSCFSVSG